MAAETACLRTMSLHLSRTLDEVGVNTDTIKRRRQAFLLEDQLHNVSFRTIGQDMYFYHFGSQSEGATTPGLESDIDRLCCLHEFNVIQEWPDWQQGQVNLLMLQDKTAPGYCYLQRLRSDVPMANEELPDDVNYTLDSNNRVILKNTVLNTPDTGSQQVRNGPACSQPGNHGFKATDEVVAFHCRRWPTEAEKFTRRHRRHGWPSQSVLQKAVKRGVFLVPVEYKLSSTEHLEWRISASLAERYLMFSLNEVHIKCLVVLKMLKETFIEPRVIKCISSYHCKTALLYSVENTEPGLWRDDNLLQCVTQCLTTLLTWVTDGFCPQFVITEENLFAGKVTAKNRKLVQLLLKELIKDTVPALLDVHIDDLGYKLQEKFSTEPSVVPVLDSQKHVLLKREFEFNRLKAVYCITYTGILVKTKCTNPAVVIRSVYSDIVSCKECIRHSQKHARQANKVYIEILSRWLGSLLASFSLSQGVRVPHIAIQLLRKCTNPDGAALLKLASVLYSTGDLHRVEVLLRRVENHVSINTMSVCGCNPDAMASLISRDPNALAMTFAHCVRFSPQEIHCVPPALRNEFFRSFGDDRQHRHSIKDEWMDLAAVDCLSYLYYLQYMTYRQLGKLDLQKQSLHNLECCLINDHVFGHLETGWNLLGQCMELEQDTQSAIACFRTSLEIRRRNNAAKWHIAILCYKLMKLRINPSTAYPEP